MQKIKVEESKSDRREKEKEIDIPIKEEKGIEKKGMKGRGRNSRKMQIQFNSSKVNICTYSIISMVVVICCVCVRQYTIWIPLTSHGTDTKHCK